MPSCSSGDQRKRRPPSKAFSTSAPEERLRFAKCLRRLRGERADQFEAALVGFCKAAGITTQRKGSKLVLLNVQLKGASPAATVRSADA